MAEFRCPFYNEDAGYCDLTAKWVGGYDLRECSSAGKYIAGSKPSVTRGYCIATLNYDNDDEARYESCGYYTSYKRMLSQYETTSNEGCFLTTACVHYLGKSDDCEELTTLRRFRDEYLKKSEEGKSIVAEYYAIAPRIVDKIVESPNKEQYYRRIYQAIQSCLQSYAKGMYDDLVRIYQSMTLQLKSELLDS